MTLDYVRDYYRVPARRGMRVRTPKGEGIITRGTNYIWVRLDGQRYSKPFHPTDGIEYLPQATLEEKP